jgi:hypothetical protein
MCGVIAFVALHALSPGQSTIPKPHPLSANQPARSTKILKWSGQTFSLKQMRLNLRIGYVNHSRHASTSLTRRQTTMTRR